MATRSFESDNLRRPAPAYARKRQKHALRRVFLLHWHRSNLTIPNAGALRVVPGSHRYGGPPPQAGPDQEPYGSIEVKVKAGDAVIFENQVLHAVGPNHADNARKNIYMGYCWRYLRPVDYVTQSAELLATATPIQRQLLGDTSSGLGYYLPRPEDVPLAQWYDEVVQTSGHI